ncbi:hypothetical protein [Bacteroidetes bacterium endosymbiont of Geopemphigus sp.]|uniref:hypothetical protein n=1 Tax=Bacteroidetes bacterium endosymbiont of Geopemphigus sp. TaxID=2047937 RepID=UPI000CD30A38|nr:hypothetical protein [Bacteroidetes bacterium endosymbiont of Geopemphigus sp.]
MGAIRDQEGRKKCLSKNFTSWQTTGRYNSKYKVQAKNEKYLLEFSEEEKETKEAEYAPYGEWWDGLENFGHSLKRQLSSLRVKQKNLLYYRL